MSAVTECSPRAPLADTAPPYRSSTECIRLCIRREMQMPDTVVERTDSGSSTGMVLGIVVVLLVAVMAFFFILGPGRGSAPTGQTNVNVPGQQAQPQAPGG